MEESYEVSYEGKTVGRIELKREGLYYRLSCRCRLQDEAIHRLYAGSEKLGVLIPENGALVLETRVAVKRLKPGVIFTLDESSEEYIPIHPGEPFSHLDKVRWGRLAFRDGLSVLLVNQYHG